MSATAKLAHLKLAHSSDREPVQDPLREAADSYLVAFRQELEAFLTLEAIEAVRVESALRAVRGEPCLILIVHEPGQDAIVNTKIFAAVQAATTYLSVMMNEMKLGPGWTWGDVRIETRFVETNATGKATAWLRAL